MAESNADKPHEPSEHRLAEARRKGQVPQAADTVSGAASVALALTLIAVGPWAFDRFGILLERLIALAALRDAAAGPSAALWAAVYGLGPVVAVLVAVPAAVALVTAFLIVGPVFAFEPLAPKLERLDPSEGFKRIVSVKGLFAVAKGLLVVSLVLGAGAATVRAWLGPIASTWRASAVGALGAMSEAIGFLVLVLAATALAASVPDLLFQRWQFLRDQRMDDEDVKREFKEQQGSPEVLGERRRQRDEAASGG